MSAGTVAGASFKPVQVRGCISGEGKNGCAKMACRAVARGNLSVFARPYADAMDGYGAFARCRLLSLRERRLVPATGLEPVTP